MQNLLVHRRHSGQITGIIGGQAPTDYKGKCLFHVEHSTTHT